MFGFRVGGIVGVKVQHVADTTHPLGLGVALEDAVHVGSGEVTVTHNSCRVKGHSDLQETTGQKVGKVGEVTVGRGTITTARVKGQNALSEALFIFPRKVP